MALLDRHGVNHALLVEPNSGYELDNRCMLDAIAGAKGRFRGIAVVRHDCSEKELLDLKTQGIVGIAINPTFHGTDYYRDVGALADRLAALDMFLQVQVEGDQMLDLLPLIESTKAKLLIDHCGRPIPEKGLEQKAFQALLRLAESGRSAVKLSGHVKFSRELYPYRDTWPFVRALADAFGLDACVWGSDWPCLRARERVPYADLLALVETLFPDSNDRRRLLWDTPRRLFGFAG
jgi:predicted TIM-barrel fold metal-dependent hydrolase